MRQRELFSCAELFVPLKEVTRRALEELARTPVDLGIAADMCKLVVKTDGGAARRPREGAVALWGLVVVLMCGNVARLILRLDGWSWTAPALNTCVELE